MESEPIARRSANAESEVQITSLLAATFGRGNAITPQTSDRLTRPMVFSRHFETHSEIHSKSKQRGNHHETELS
jgi:hypothetical protein